MKATVEKMPGGPGRRQRSAVDQMHPLFLLHAREIYATLGACTFRRCAGVVIPILR